MTQGDDNQLGSRWRAQVTLKRDVFSTVERGKFTTPDGEVDAVLRRIDEVPWWTRPLARHLFRREVRSLAIAGKLNVAPPLLFANEQRLVRGYIHGTALKIARPYGDHAYFRSARTALRALHRARISHNDLAKEQNWLRGVDGRAYLLDFQLASTFSRRNWLFRLTAYEDLRHLLKHKRRYVPETLTACERRVVSRKALHTRIWMATGKRVYFLITRGIFGFVDAEGGGKRIAHDTPMIEAALKAHPQVREAAVLDFPDRRGGSGLYAFVETEPSLNEETLRRYLAETVGADRAPDYVQIVATLPRSANAFIRGDILRLISTNQVDLLDPLIVSESERAAVAQIVRARKNLYGTEELAAAMKRHPRVRDAVVLAFPDRLAGTGLYAFVEADHGLSEDAIRDFAVTEVGKAEAPQHIQVVGALPRNADGAIRTEILLPIAINQVDRIVPMITSEAERALVQAIADGRKNFRDRFVL
jgi:AMP-binding enzyme C-terminal domain